MRFGLKKGVKAFIRLSHEPPQEPPQERPQERHPAPRKRKTRKETFRVFPLLWPEMTQLFVIYLT